MQLRLTPRNRRGIISKNFLFKTVLIFIIFFLVIFFLDRVNFPKPSKFIKEEISNEKLTTLK